MGLLRKHACVRALQPAKCLQLPVQRRQRLARVPQPRMEPFLGQLLRSHSPTPRTAGENRGFRSREAAAPARVTSRDVGVEVWGLPGHLR